MHVRLGRPALALAAAALLALAGCGQGDAPLEAAQPSEAEGKGAVVAPLGEPDWGYEGEIGPANWADLDPEYGECSSGRQQSPIDLSPDLSVPEPADVPPVTFDYTAADFEAVDVGHTVQADAGSAGGVTIGGEFYQLAQVHVHAPSEHALQGQRSDLSVHLVHRNANGDLAVVGVFVEPGEESGVDTLFRAIPAEESVSVPGFDAATLLPDDMSTYRYDGSLTTPPCSEDVQWLVMPDVVTAAPEVVSAIAEAVEGTARPLQPINDRDVVLVESS